MICLPKNLSSECPWILICLTRYTHTRCFSKRRRTECYLEKQKSFSSIMVHQQQGFRLRPEAGGRTFPSVVFHPMSGTLMKISAVFLFYFFLLSFFFYLSNTWTYCHSPLPVPIPPVQFHYKFSGDFLKRICVNSNLARETDSARNSVSEAWFPNDRHDRCD